MAVKTKRKLAPWVAAFPKQHAALSPEKSAAGGVKARSGSEAVRMAVYQSIRKLYLNQHLWCQCCPKVRGVDFNDARLSTEVHHVRGRDGWLLVDVRYWKATCSECHRWIDAHRPEARALGLLAEAGDWRKEQA